MELGFVPELAESKSYIFFHEMWGKEEGKS